MKTKEKKYPKIEDFYNNIVKLILEKRKKGEELKNSKMSEFTEWVSYKMIDQKKATLKEIKNLVRVVYSFLQVKEAGAWFDSYERQHEVIKEFFIWQLQRRNDICGHRYSTILDYNIADYKTKIQELKKEKKELRKDLSFDLSENTREQVISSLNEILGELNFFNDLVFLRKNILKTLKKTEIPTHREEILENTRNP